MTVIRSEALTLEQLKAEHPTMTHLIISPGPGHPLKDSGISIPAIDYYAGKIPILGVCMGLQCITVNYGGIVDQAGEYVHGKTSPILHDGKGLFKGLQQGVAGTRYHSLAARINSLPECLEVTSRTEGGIVMGLRHRDLVVESVQYHPESILSDEGKLMLANFLSWNAGKWSDLPDALTPAGSHVPHAASTLAPAANSTTPATAVPTILNKIEKQRILDVAKATETPGYRPADLASLIALQVPPPLISFHERLRPSLTSTSTAPSLSVSNHVALLAEVKRASPSKGDIVDAASAPSAPAIALSYALAGASVISVLTEPKWFKGSLDDMRAVRAVVDSLPNRPAILRKDFILDPYQIDEARVYGADTVLLIVAMLDDAQLELLYDHAVERGMEPLVEVNNAEELERALRVGAKVIGVNNRNLHDFNVDMNTTSRIADVIRERYPERAGEIILIALSGITGREDVVRYQEQGVSAVLVGESLMRANDKGAFVRKLLGLDQQPASSSSSSLVNGAAAAVQSVTSTVVNAVKGTVSTATTTTTTSQKGSPLVKICGLQTPEAALAAAEAGADLLGLIFVPKSKRNVSLPQAQVIVDAVRARHNSSTTVSDAAAAATALDPTDWFSFQASRIASHPRKPLFVGVFQNASLATILSAVDSLRLDLVQLHGSEPTHWARLIPVPVIRAFHVDEKVEADLKEAEQLREATREGYHALALLDTKVSHEQGALSGGAGKAFDWNVARRLVGSRQTLIGGGGQTARLPIVLAGGLDAGNLRQAIETVRPFAVDVSGGVETAGEKDLDKIREFVRVAKLQA